MLPDSLSRVEHKLLCWLGVQNSGLNDAQVHLLGVTIEKYLMLSEIEEEEYMEALRLKDMTIGEAMAAFPELNVTTTYEKYFLDKGLEQGRVEEAQRVLLSIMRYKFGVLPTAVERKVNAITDLAQLETFILRMFSAQSVDDFGLGETV